MKRNIIAISLMAAGLFTFGNVYAEDVKYPCQRNGRDAYSITSDNGDYQCPSTFKDAINIINDSNGSTGEIVLLKEKTTLSTTLPAITKDVTVDLGGNTLELATSVEIDGANVTFRNGTIKVSGTSLANMFTVKSANGETSLTLEKDITLKGKVDESNKLTNNVIKVEDSASNKTTININGDWTILKEIIDCDPSKDHGENLIVNLNANVISDEMLLNIDAGTSTVNVLGGTYTSKSENAIKLSNGTLSVTDGKIIAKSGSTIYTCS